MRSSVRLLPGSLVTAGALSDGPPRAPGTSVIGALVRSGQYPLGLRSGDEVLVVVTGDAVSSERNPIAATIVSIAASGRSEEHKSELQSQMRISYTVFCLKNK